MRRAAIALAVLPLLACSGLMGSKPSPTTSAARPAAETVPPRPEAPLKVRLTDLCWDYVNNPVAADAKYKGQWIDTTIGTGELLSPQAMAKSDSGESILVAWLAPEPAKYKPNVVGRINPAKLAAFASVPNPKAVHVYAYCKGARAEPLAWKEFAIDLDHCELAEADK